MARECWRSAEPDGTLTKSDVAQLLLADRLKELVEKRNPLAERADLYSNLLSGALANANWREVAGAFGEEGERE